MAFQQNSTRRFPVGPWPHSAQVWVPSCGVGCHHSLHAVIPLLGTFSQAGPVPRKTTDNLSPQQPHSTFQPHESTPSRGELPDQFWSDFSVSCSDSVWCLQQQGLITVMANRAMAIACVTLGASEDSLRNHSLGIPWLALKFSFYNLCLLGSICRVSLFKLLTFYSLVSLYFHWQTESRLLYLLTNIRVLIHFHLSVYIFFRRNKNILWEFWGLSPDSWKCTIICAF